MTFGSRRIGRMLCHAGAALLLAMLQGCSYLTWRRENMGYGATHDGIPSDQKALEELGRVLAETTGPTRARKPAS